MWNQPEVSLVLSGMSSMPQVVENLRVAGEAEVDSLKPAELELIAAARRKFEERKPVPCTRCGYCMPCPNGVDIRGNFELYNMGEVYEDVKGTQFRYNQFLDEADRASACVGCKACETKCPQHIPISEWMPKVAALLGEPKK